jgi:ketosteroid isomerase-like protein
MVQQETIRTNNDQGLAEEKTKSSANEIHQFMANYAEAVRNGNIEEILTYYSDDVEAFDCPPPLIYHGIREYEDTWKHYYSSEFEFPVMYEFIDEKIFVNGPLASFYCLVHMKGTFKESKKETAAWLRLTCILEKTKGYWQIVHDHVSVPVDNQGKALMNLDPQDHSHH